MNHLVCSFQTVELLVSFIFLLFLITLEREGKKINDARNSAKKKTDRKSWYAIHHYIILFLFGEYSQNNN